MSFTTKQALPIGMAKPSPSTVASFSSLPVPDISALDPIRKGSGKQEVATTMALVRVIKELLRDKENGPGWWKLFGFSGSLPTKLSIITVVAMPKGDKDQIYPGEIIKIGANDELVLQYIYIDGSTGQPISTTYP